MDALFLLVAVTSAPDSASAAGWLLLGLAALAVVSEKLLVISDRVRGKGPTASDLQTFASQDELDRTNARVSKLETSLAHELAAINRALGRIEGELGTK